jgi:hypothetical protein
VPEDFLVLDGQFAVREEAGNRFLELPGDPLESFGVLFGPSAREGLSVSARIHGTGKGRRFPAFAVSLGGINGFRLQVTPGKKAIEILQGDQPVQSEPFDWVSGQWTHLRLQVVKAGDDTWHIQGKAWVAGTPEPTDWTITLTRQQEPIPGRPGMWGQPFAGTPIRFDDVRVDTVSP